MCSLWFSPTHLAAAGTALHESGANHVLGEEVGVGVPADPVIDDGLPQTLQPVRKVVCGAGRQVLVTVPNHYVNTTFNLYNRGNVVLRIIRVMQ